MRQVLAGFKRLLKPWLRDTARIVAPFGTRRRRLLELALSRLGYGVWSKWRPANLPPFPDHFEREPLNRFLESYGVRVPARPELPVTESSAVRSILDILIAIPDLRRRFPDALSAGRSGRFAAWLAREGAVELGLTSRCVELLLAAFDRHPGRSVLQRLDHYPGARKGLPLVGTPLERGPLVAWCFHYRTMLDLTAEEILWFFLEQDEHVGRCLARHYRGQPEWQKAVPAGLTRDGWDALRRWVSQRYRVQDAWLLQAAWPGEAEERALESRRGVNVMGHLCYPSGLQVAALNTIEALHRAGWAVSSRDVPSNVKADLPNRDQYLGLHPFPVTISQLPPEPLAANSYHFAGLAMRSDTYRIGYWYWELEQAPTAWKRHRHWLHELWAPTRFIGNALRGVMPMPVIDMLPGMAMPPEISMPRSRFNLPDDRFAFLFMFDMGSTMERKNPLATVEAFRRAFTPDEDVILILKVSRGWQDPAGLAALREVADGRRIFLIDDVFTPDELFGLLGCCDAYVSLHRSEGFGLTMAEAMALGKPVVATGYSGNLDFMDASNSLLVRYEKVPLRNSTRVYRKGYLWAEPSVEHAAESMRWTFTHPQEARALGERARVSIRATLSLDAAARRMTERLEVLQPQVRQRRRAA